VTGGSFRRHLSAMIASEIVARTAQFAILATAARALSPVAFGIYGLAVALYQPALAVVQGGPELHAARLLAQGRGGAALVLRLMRLKAGFAAVAYLAVCLLALAAYRDAAALRQIMVQALLLPIAAVGSTWALKAVDRFAAFAALRCCQAVLFLGLAVLFLAYGASPLALPLAEATATATVSLAAMRYCLRRAGRGMPPSGGSLFGPSLALGLSGLCSDAIWSMPVTMGGLFLDAASLGRVAGVNRMLTALNGFFQGMVQVFYPSLARRYARDPEAGAALAATLLLYVAIGSVIVVAIGLTGAAPLIRLLLGPGKEQAIPVFRLCLTALPPAFVGSVVGYALLAAGHHRTFSRLAFAALAVTCLCAGAGYWLSPIAEMASSQSLALTLYAAELFVAAASYRLIGKTSWSMVRPAALRGLLNER